MYQPLARLLTLQPQARFGNTPRLASRKAGGHAAKLSWEKDEGGNEAEDASIRHPSRDRRTIDQYYKYWRPGTSSYCIRRDIRIPVRRRSRGSRGGQARAELVTLVDVIPCPTAWSYTGAVPCGRVLAIVGTVADCGKERTNERKAVGRQLNFHRPCSCTFDDLALRCDRTVVIGRTYARVLCPHRRGASKCESENEQSVDPLHYVLSLREKIADHIRRVRGLVRFP